MRNIDIEYATSKLRQAGKRVTRERTVLMRFLLSNPHLDAKELYTLARRRIPNLSLSTVYRTLKLFQELDLIRVAELGEEHVHYEAHTSDHYHCVCLQCGKIIEIPPSSLITSLVEDMSFEVISVNVEFAGYCNDCVRQQRETTCKQ